MLFIFQEPHNYCGSDGFFLERGGSGSKGPKTCGSGSQALVIYVIYFSPELESRRLSSESVVFPDHADGGPGELKGGGLSSQLGGSTSIKFTTQKCFDLN